jgi:hypothetical protein
MEVGEENGFELEKEDKDLCEVVEICGKVKLRKT